MNRRNFFRKIGLGTAGLFSLKALPQLQSEVKALGRDSTYSSKRASAGATLRERAMRIAFRRGEPKHPTNSDEKTFSNFIGNFSKTLQHDESGEVLTSAYQVLRRALKRGKFTALNQIQIGERRLTNPQAGLAFTLQGPDSHMLKMKAAPSITSAEASAEMAELYWKSLARDVPFADYGTSNIISDAAQDITDNYSGYNGANILGRVSAQNIFRGTLFGDEKGPYLSQFLVQPIPSGSLTYVQKQTTALPAVNYMTNKTEWLKIQNGSQPSAGQEFDETIRYIRSGRDLAEYVHDDGIIQPYYNAAMILLHYSIPTYDKGNPYYSQSHSDVFATFGRGHIIGLLGEAISIALKAAWHQKWFIHRRLRPEAFGGLVNETKSGNKSYPLHDELLNSIATERAYDEFGTYLLAQGYPEGSPTHPAYPAGHATIAGAMVTLLKAFFDEDIPIENPVVASSDGLSLSPYNKSDANTLTIGSELNKLASNIALGRNWAGIHYRTDASAGFELGEQVAIKLLKEQKLLVDESYSFEFRRFNGIKVQIGKR